MSYQEQNAKAENIGGTIAGGCGCFVLFTIVIFVVACVVLL